MGYSVHSRAHFSSSSSWSGSEYNTNNNDPAPDKHTTNPNKNREEDKVHKCHEALKLILGFYYKSKRFSSAVDEYWLPYLASLNETEEEHESDADNPLMHFIHSQKPARQDYQFWQQFRCFRSMSWILIIRFFEAGYYSTVKLAKAWRKLKVINITTFQLGERTDVQLFRQLLQEL